MNTSQGVADGENRKFCRIDTPIAGETVLKNEQRIKEETVRNSEDGPE